MTYEGYPLSMTSCRSKTWKTSIWRLSFWLTGITFTYSEFIIWNFKHVDCDRSKKHFLSHSLRLHSQPLFFFLFVCSPIFIGSDVFMFTTLNSKHMMCPPSIPQASLPFIPFWVFCNLKYVFHSVISTSCCAVDFHPSLPLFYTLLNVFFFLFFLLPPYSAFPLSLFFFFLPQTYLLLCNVWVSY